MIFPGGPGLDDWVDDLAITQDCAGWVRPFTDDQESLSVPLSQG